MPGRATRLLSRVARVVATAYPESAQFLHAKAVVTGTPVRREFWKPREDFPLRPQGLLILGGSQGAHRINEAVAAAITELTSRLGLDVWHQTGEPDFAWLQSFAPTSGGRYHPFAFADDLAAKVYAADLVLSRAGAGSISEVSAAGIPMVLVPGPFAGGHQRLNAQPFERAGAAHVIANEDCDGPRLVREIAAIANDPGAYSKMVIAMRGLGRPRAAEEVAGLLQAAVNA